MKTHPCQRRTWCTVNLDHAAYNFKEIRKRSQSKLCCVIKANAYGHGAIELAALYQELGADFLAVSNIEEALQLRKNDITLPILILGYTPPECAADLSLHDIRQTVYSLDYARELIRCAEACRVTVKIHVKIDTGMGRIGFQTDECSLSSIVSLCDSKALVPEGIFTHFAVSDEGEDGEEYTRRQYEVFQSAINYLLSKGLSFPLKHCSNSAATLDYGDYQLDMIRAGIILYGLSPSEKVRCTIPLRKVMELRSVISHIKEIRSGESVSYGRTFIASKPMKIATVAIGYADGFWRSNGNLRYALKVNGCYAPIIGRICMDQIMIDVTDVDCVIGDEALIFGDDPLCSAQRIAMVNDTIEYEVVCAVGNRVPRFFLKNNAIFSVMDTIYNCDDNVLP